MVKQNVEYIGWCVDHIATMSVYRSEHQQLTWTQLPETPQSHAADSARSSLGVIRRSSPPVHFNKTAASLRYLDIQIWTPVQSGDI